MKENNQNYLRLGDLCKQGGRNMQQSGSKDHLPEAELLLADLLNISREYLLSHPEQKIEENIKKKYEKLITERKKGVPIAYLTGYKEFYGLRFAVNKNVLIPRPETELLVDEVLKRLARKKGTKKVMIADIGAGSGCIPVSLLKNGKEKIDKIFCSDTSRQALKTAYFNAVAHGVEGCIKFLHGNFALPLFYELKDIKKSSEFIVTANLPYLSEEKYKNSPSIQKEPPLALLGGGSDGLEAYKILLHQLHRLDTKIRSKILIFCELDDDQVELFKEIVVDLFTFYKLTFKKDLKGNYRLAILELK
ncbi:MAG: peptide chain release factor N(5)-glutamine methyltransferase [Patescibacteria group bacterium]